VAIARALVNEPRLLLADEPTGNLDEDSSVMVIELLEKVRADHACTLVMVTHNHQLATRAEQRIPLDRGHRIPTSAPV
jgi:putative ABC transport system ATP-binding protein